MRRSLRGLSSDDACPPLAPSLPPIHTISIVIRHTYVHTPSSPLALAFCQPPHMKPLLSSFSIHSQGPSPPLTREELRICADLPPSCFDLGRRLVERVGE